MGKQSTLKMEVEVSLKRWCLFPTPHGATTFGLSLATHRNGTTKYRLLL